MWKDRKNYLEEAEKQLSDIRTYEEMTFNEHDVIFILFLKRAKRYSM